MTDDTPGLYCWLNLVNMSTFFFIYLMNLCRLLLVFFLVLYIMFLIINKFNHIDKNACVLCIKTFLCVYIE